MFHCVMSLGFFVLARSGDGGQKDVLTCFCNSRLMHCIVSIQSRRGMGWKRPLHRRVKVRDMLSRKSSMSWSVRHRLI